MPSAMTGQIPEGGQYDALLGSTLRFSVTFGESSLNNYTFNIKPTFFSKAIPTFSKRLYICAF